ncbi:MAG: hypothetical protein Q4D26_10405 [Clostridia bacterium]|nr:hypothetical protein [Clostridia bacterium]
MIKIGKISSYDKENLTARVYYEESGNVSGLLQILESCRLPLKIDEYVICAYSKQGDGFILGRLYEQETGE